jgi:hypothetical protein
MCRDATVGDVRDLETQNAAQGAAPDAGKAGKFRNWQFLFFPKSLNRASPFWAWRSFVYNRLPSIGPTRRDEP